MKYFLFWVLNIFLFQTVPRSAPPNLHRESVGAGRRQEGGRRRVHWGRLPVRPQICHLHLSVLMLITLAGQLFARHIKYRLRFVMTNSASWRTYITLIFVLQLPYLLVVSFSDQIFHWKLSLWVGHEVYSFIWPHMYSKLASDSL